MRKARSKIRAKFADRKPGSEEFGRMLEEELEKQELMAEYEAIKKGMNYRKMSEERKRAFLCEIFN